MKDKKETNGNLFHKDFTLVVIGQIISLFGNAILRFALPLYLLRETGSSTLFGVVTACSFIPMIVFSLAGGVLADRLNKRNIMVTLDFSVAVLIIIFYVMLGKLPVVPLMIVCLMLLYGISGTYQPTVQASIPLLVGREKIMQGNAVINMVSTLANLLGPVIGGILFGAWGLVPILFISIVCFISSAVMELFIHIPFVKQKKQAGVYSIVKHDLGESWQFVKNEKPVYISVVLVLALFNLVLSAALIVGIPIIVVTVLGMPDANLGFTQGALGLGGLAGGCLAGVVSGKMKLRNSYVLLIICALSAAFMGVALLPGIPPFLAYMLISAMSFIAMGMATLFTIQMSTIVQQQTPPHLIGKIMAAIMAATMCAQPIGQAVFGILFDVCSQVPWAVMLGAGTASFLVAVYSKKAFLRLEEDNR